MKTFLLTTAVIGALISYSCNHSHNDETTHDSHTNAVEQTEAPAEEHHHSENEQIALNNGAKWKVEENMMSYIRKMETHTDQLSKQENKQLSDFSTLADSLQANVELLTTRCTMKGEAHDELHKWLVPYMDLVSSLQKSKDQEEARHVFEQIEESFKTFNTYFE